jgi:hypothetical protein
MRGAPGLVEAVFSQQRRRLGVVVMVVGGFVLERWDAPTQPSGGFNTVL